MASHVPRTRILIRILLPAGAGLLGTTCSSGGGDGATAPAPTVASISVDPATKSILAGTTVQLAATGKSSDGTVLTGRLVTWSSSDSTLATVSASGLVTGVVAGGPVTITASSEGVNGTRLAHRHRGHRL